MAAVTQKEDKVKGHKKRNGKGHAWAIPEGGPDNLVIKGTITVSGTYARILIDCGASHCFISRKFSRPLGLKISTLPYLLRVTTPVSRDVKLRDVCRACLMGMVGCEFTFDLILLDMSEFYVIIRMDWLTAFRAHIDCFNRKVTF